MKRLCLILLFLIAPILKADVSEENVRQFFHEYLRTLKADQFEGAEEFWSLYDRTLTDQLGIEYEGVPMKLEAGSAIIQHLDDLRTGEASITLGQITFNRGYAQIEYTLSADDTTYTGVYYVNVEANVRPELATPLQVFTENWDMAEGRYFDLFYRTPILYESANIELADGFISQCAGRLGITPEKISVIENSKFRIFLCESEGKIGQLTGHVSPGTFYQSGDAVVSRYFPPYDQIAQFLIAYKLQTLPLHTLPMIKGGTNTFLGGRHGRSAEVSLMIGRYIYSQGFTKLEELMTAEGFTLLENNPDFSYNVAAVFCQYLFDKLGNERFLQLYRKFSGSEEEVNSFTMEKVKALLTDELGMKWSAIEDDLKATVESTPVSGVFAGSEEKGELIYESGLPNLLIKVYEDDTFYNFIIKSDSANYGAALLAGNPLSDSRFESFLFTEQFPETEYEHQKYGVLFSSVEVGCYNYLSNQIAGKYIVGFTGDAPLSAEAGIYRFKIDKALMPDLAKQLISIVPMR